VIEGEGGWSKSKSAVFGGSFTRWEERRVEFSLQSFETSFFLPTLSVSVSICHDFHENLLLVTQTSEVSSFRCKAQLLWFLLSSEFLVVCFPESVHFLTAMDGSLIEAPKIQQSSCQSCKPLGFQKIFWNSGKNFPVVRSFLLIPSGEKILLVFCFSDCVLPPSP